MGETEVVHTEKNNMTLAFGRFTQTYREREMVLISDHLYGEKSWREK